MLHKITCFFHTFAFMHVAASLTQFIYRFLLDVLLMIGVLAAVSVDTVMMLMFLTEIH